MATQVAIAIDPILKRRWEQLTSNRRAQTVTSLSRSLNADGHTKQMVKQRKPSLAKDTTSKAAKVNQINLWVVGGRYDKCSYSKARHKETTNAIEPIEPLCHRITVCE